MPLSLQILLDFAQPVYDAEMQTKAQIRSAVIKKRDALSPSDVTSMSADVHARLRSLDAFSVATEVLIYVSKGNEVETHTLIEELLREGRAVRVPISGEDGRLSWSSIRSLEELQPASFEILEPRDDALLIRPNDAALVLTPCVAFTTSGHRLGHGKGYYDRFLHAHSGPSIGLAFELQKHPSLPVEAHDVALDIIVTEATTYRIT